MTLFIRDCGRSLHEVWRVLNVIHKSPLCKKGLKTWILPGRQDQMVMFKNENQDEGKHFFANVLDYVYLWCGVKKAVPPVATWSNFSL